MQSLFTDSQISRAKIAQQVSVSCMHPKTGRFRYSREGAGVKITAAVNNTRKQSQNTEGFWLLYIQMTP